MAKSAKVLKHPAAVARGFESAGIHPALSQWIAAAVPADNDILAGLRQVRARSRDAAQNDDHMRLFLKLVESNVIGSTGVVVQSRARQANGRPDKTASARIEDAWLEQCERGNWSVCGQFSRRSLSRLGVRTVAQDGEVLIRVHRGGNNSPTGWGVEIIDSETLDMDYNDELPNGNTVRMGVEMTPLRRPIAYHLIYEPVSPYSGYKAGRERLRIPAEEIHHVYLPEWVWGTRGVPWTATALRRLKMLGGYEEAAITAARAAAVKSAVYTRQEWAPPETRPAGFEADDGSMVQDLTPGGVEVAPYGYDLKPLDWQWPNTDHGDFCKEALRGIASGLGVTYNALANDLEGVNFSSLRQGALSERDFWMLLQDWWIEWAERPLYQDWLDFALMTGTVTQRNGEPYPPDRWRRLRPASFQGRRWKWVDPEKEMKAHLLAVSLGAQSVSAVIRESGRDPDEVWQELGDDLARLQALGLTLNDILNPTGQAATGAGTEETTDE